LRHRGLSELHRRAALGKPLQRCRERRRPGHRCRREPGRSDGLRDRDQREHGGRRRLRDRRDQRRLSLPRPPPGLLNGASVRADGMAMLLRGRLLLVAALAGVVISLWPQPAFALTPSMTTSWTGGGTPVNGNLSWSDPANWDNGVPQFLADVTIAPTITTHVSDVPSIRLN